MDVPGEDAVGDTSDEVADVFIACEIGQRVPVCLLSAFFRLTTAEALFEALFEGAVAGVAAALDGLIAGCADWAWLAVVALGASWSIERSPAAIVRDLGK